MTNVKNSCLLWNVMVLLWTSKEIHVDSCITELQWLFLLLSLFVVPNGIMPEILRWLGTPSWTLSQQCTIFSETRKTSSVFAIYVLVAFVVILGSLHAPRTDGHKLEEHWKGKKWEMLFDIHTMTHSHTHTYRHTKLKLVTI